MKLQGRNLSIRMKGNDVKFLHSELKLLEYTLPSSETEEAFFGEETRKAVLAFQKQHGLQETGIVDGRTAQQINAAVEARQAKEFVVQGQIFQPDGQTPARDVIVKAYDMDLRTEQLLGEELIDNEKGFYRIEYTADQFTRAEKQSADLKVRVFSVEGFELAASDILFNAPVQAKMDLVLKKPELPSKLSEYEKLLVELAPVLQDVKLVELTEEDITFLVKETGIEQKLIEFLVQSAQLSNETDLATEVFYGFARQNLPPDLESLLNQTPEVLREALKAAVKEKIIPSSLLERLEDIMTRIEQLRFEYGVMVMQDFFGRLLSKETSTPLVSYMVRAFDLDAGETPEELGHVISDSRGRFTLSYPVLKSELPDEGSTNGPQKRLRLHIIDPQGEEIHQQEIRIKIVCKQVVKFEIPVPAPVEPPSPTLKELDKKLKLQLPQGLLSHLADNGIHSLHDICKIGSIEKIKGVDPDDPAVQILDAHSRLYTSSPDPQANAELIKRGYTGPSSVARACRTDIVGSVHEVVGDFQAARTYVETLAGTYFLNNVITNLSVEKANGRKIPQNLDIALKEDILPSKCHCHNCEAAMSPMAYLADLLDYAATHLKLYEDEDDNTGTSISLGYLKENFHQPFGDLPTSCEELERKVRQVRICIEALRSYLGNRPLADVDKENALSASEREHCNAVYTTLLSRIGASYEEIRLAQTAEEESREVLANRLGIGIEHLDGLLLYLEAITEQNIERLFGLADTTRDVLSEGAKLKDDDNQLTRWNLNGVEWNKNTDAEGDVYIKLKNPTENEYKVEMYRDLERTELLAYGKRNSAEGKIELSPENGSRLSGSVNIDYDTGSENIVISLIPDFLSWRFLHLRTLWKSLDYPDDLYTEETSVPLPIIDPDLIGPGDLREPTEGEAYELWQSRHNWVVDQLDAVQSEREAETNPLDGLNVIMEGALGVPVTDLLALEEERKQGNDITAPLDQIGLTNDGFSYLLRIHDLLNSSTPGKDPLLPSEWDDVYSILVQAQKRREFAEWREEERAINILIGPDHFAIPEPSPLEFPPKEPVPLPAWRATEQARRDWQDRLRSRIEQEKNAVDELAELVNSTEEQSLATLRNALITATNESARWLTENLLIDCENDGCKITTRIGRAIETIQVLLWSIRTAQLNDTHPDFGLDADNFDGEWKWIGSYETWRAAILVFLYPENILLPSLRRWQTPAFGKLVKDVRNNRRLTPEHACEAARDYSGYFEDSCTLKLEASCQIETTIHKEEGCRDRIAAGSSNLFHMFARGGKSNTVYWSTYDPHDETDYSQNFWQAVPGMNNVVGFAGVAPYVISPKERYLYAFAIGSEQKLVFSRYDLNNQTWDAEPAKLAVPKDRTRFTAIVKQHERETKPPHLAIRLPGGIIYDRHLNAEGNDWADENSWPADEMDGDWHILVNRNKGKEFKKLCAMIELDSKNFYLFVQDKDRKIHYRLFGKKDDGYWCAGPTTAFHIGEFIGAFCWPSTSLIYIYWKLTNGSPVYRSILSSERTHIKRVRSFDSCEIWFQKIGGISLEDLQVGYKDSKMSLLNFFNLDDDSDEYKRVAWDVVNSLEGLIKNDARFEEWKIVNAIIKRLYGCNIPSLLRQLLGSKLAGGTADISFKKRSDEYSELFNAAPGLERIAARSVQLPGYGHFQFASQYTGGQVGVYRSILVKPGGDKLEERRRFRIAPVCITLFDIKEQYSEAELQSRRLAIKKAFTDNADGPQSNLIYLKEAYYFVPVHLALQLQRRGQYIAAQDYFRSVYNYAAPVEERKIYYGLKEEEDYESTYKRVSDWLLDPLNPHAIAATRANTYTRFTLFTIIRCFLEYAHAEFTRDTAESTARARTLYMTALELLEAPELQQNLDECDELIGTIVIRVGDEDQVWQPVADEVMAALRKIPDPTTLATVVTSVKEVLAAEEPLGNRLAQARSIISEARGSMPGPVNMATVIANHAEMSDKVHATLLTLQPIFETLKQIGAKSGNDFSYTVSLVTGIDAKTLNEEKENTDVSWLAERPSVSLGEATELLDNWPNNTELCSGAVDLFPHVAPLHAVKLVQKFSFPYFFGPSFHFCVLPNPLLKALRLHAELNLYKIRTCRNIAGDQRQLEPYAASTGTEAGMPIIGAGGRITSSGTIILHPTQYRYETLIERAKQLISLAQQIESAFLSASEKGDAERYNLLKARQEVRIARAGVRLQNLRVREAEDGVDLAELQQVRTKIQRDHFEELLYEGFIWYEKAAIGFMITAAYLHTSAAVLHGAGEILAAITFGIFGEKGGAAEAASSLAAAASTTASIFQFYASHERREQEWRLQRDLAQQDIHIGTRQIRLAQDHVRVVGQERNISAMQAEHAEVTADFLANKFTNVELYDWMSDVLEGVYSFFLQQATAMSQLAASQLAFERQEVLPPMIQADYWEAPVGMGMGISQEEGTAPDRRGLTGSARLLQDIYQLDQYAFDTDKRKLQLTKTISLAQMAPAEFQRFRETGVIHFNTLMEMFDRDFPGHYLRLIKRVRTSVIALIPPTEGIKATLSTTGVSRVIIGSAGTFQTIDVNRSPQSVALSSPRDATGLFELTMQPQSGKMLYPFEGMGVDTAWEFSMPKAANLFDYSTIADVLITIEYTALNSFDYRQQVMQHLDRRISADRPFSFRQQFADQWYDLHNPDQTATPMVVRFTTQREDFPPNIEDWKIQQVVLYFARNHGASFEIPVTHLHFTEQDSVATVGGGATSNDGVISTRRGNAGSWISMINKLPFGEWELALPNTEEMKNRFKDEEIEDILFVMTYKGKTPEWPS
ncbi:MAG: peptidoglycan-binding protein [Deltaproteobacteria bacterium]|jgi:hypothetical protein|nr:peptidoglycan-binding protein [Deltaproteobacteria bacterium]